MNINKKIKINWRIDLIFSYWIYVWFVLYYFTGLIPYNPLIILTVALIINIIHYTILFTINKKKYYKDIVWSLIFAIFFAKLVPIILISDHKIHLIKDIKFSILLVLVWIIYLFTYCIFTNQSIINIIKSSSNIFENKDKKYIYTTPMMWISYHYLIKGSNIS